MIYYNNFKTFGKIIHTLTLICRAEALEDLIGVIGYNMDAAVVFDSYAFDFLV